MKGKVTLLNMVSGLALQVLTIISGFIMPRLILVNFGSNVNGLVSSLSQFLSYISLVEGGVSGVIMAALYKPITAGDQRSVNAVLVAARRFFRQIGLIFIVYSLSVAFLYPVLFHVDFDYWYIVALTMILSITLTVQYMFSLTLKTYLTADKKVYIVSLSQCTIVVLNVLLGYLSTVIYPSIHLLKAITGLLYVLQPVIYGHYIKKHYDVNWHEQPDNALIKNRWNGFAINIAAFIHYSTDITILTIFTDLATVSIYSVYALVTNGLRQLINALINGINPTLGHAYARGDEPNLNEKMDLYEYIVFVLVGLLYTMAAMLIAPFIVLYTKNINDADYYRPVFGVLLALSEAVYLVKSPHLSLAYAANHFKEISVPAYIEAGVNIVISSILVSRYGLIGVAIGTIVAMTYRMVFHVGYTSKIIGHRPQRVFYRKLLIFAAGSLAGALICTRLLPLREITIAHWIGTAVLYMAVLGAIYAAISLTFFRRELRFFMRYLKKR